MSNTAESRLPIGYWLKRADAALTERIDEAQRANGVTRVEWQILNLLHESAGGRSGADAGEHAGPEADASAGTPAANARETMRPFLDDAAFDDVVAGLASRGLIAGAGGRLTLTGEGSSRHAAMLAVQRELRGLAMRGIDEEEYATTVRVLQRIVTNLTT